jgi:hypothetical protein
MARRPPSPPQPPGASPNGHPDASALEAVGLAFARKTRWVAVPDYGEDGGPVVHQAELWSNYPQRLIERIRGADRDESERALGEVVLRHRLLVDGQERGPWRDFDGSELPPPSDPVFWKAIPLDVAVALIRLVDEEPTRLPNFQPRTRPT